MILAHLPAGFVEGGAVREMISYFIPPATYPDTYNGASCSIALLASQKRHISLYPMGVYANDYDARWFRERWAATGKRFPDMGKSCVRFRQLDDVPST